MKSNFWLCIVALVVLSSLLQAQTLPNAAPETVGLSRECLDRIKPHLEEYITRNQLVGGTALIARRGKIAYFETFGAIDKASGKPMPKDAIFPKLLTTSGKNRPPCGALSNGSDSTRTSFWSDMRTQGC